MTYNIRHDKDFEDLVTHAVAQSSVNILHEIDAKGIVAFSASGSTGKLISKSRPSKLVFAFTPSLKVYSRLSLVWGVVPMYISVISDAKKLIQAGENLLIDKKLAKRGDIIVITIGMGLKKGSTNLIKIHKVGYED